MTRTIRLVLLALIAIAAALATASIVGLLQTGAPPATTTVGGPFTLTDESGKPVTNADFKGRYMLLFFGFTYCPDVCPMTLQRIADALDAAPALKDKVTPVLITVDPARDTPAKMKDYVHYFGPNFRGLTGTAEQIAATLKAFGVYARRVDLKDSALGYTMDHSSLLYLFDRDGNFVTLFDPSLDSAALAAKLKESVN